MCSRVGVYNTARSPTGVCTVHPRAVGISVDEIRDKHRRRETTSQTPTRRRRRRRRRRACISIVMCGCCARLTGISELPASTRAAAAAPPPNTRYCHRLRFGLASGGLAEFHLTWVGADARGLFVSIMGDSALVPWSEVSVERHDDSGWVWIRWSHLDLRLLARAYSALVEPAMPHPQPLQPLSEPAAIGVGG